MPLLNDAKSCYVGTQPITTIMAGSVQVWPKSPVELLDFEEPQWNAFPPNIANPNLRLCAFSWRVDGDLCAMWKDGTLVFRLYNKPAPNGYFSHNGAVFGTQAPTGSIRCYTENNRIYFSDDGISGGSMPYYSTKCAICQYYKGTMLQESRGIVPNETFNPYPPIEVGFQDNENICT